MQFGPLIAAQPVNIIGEKMHLVRVFLVLLKCHLVKCLLLVRRAAVPNQI